MLEEIKKRNDKILNELLKKYEIEKSVKNLLIDYDSIFVSEEYMNKEQSNLELKRAILYANVKFIVVNEKFEKTNKKEILYNFGKKAMKGLSNNKINLIINELKLIGYLIKQLKLIQKFEIEENDIQTIINNNFSISLQTTID
jgi:hypothetical protein